MKQVSYSDQTLNTPNPIARFAHRSRLRRSVSYASKLLPQGGKLADFGCGTGDFLNALSLVRSDSVLIGSDPFQVGRKESFNRVTDISTIAAESIDVLCCFEVLEHLSDEEISSFISLCRRIVKPGGRVLVSVPIMGGLTLLLKEGNRAFLFRRKSDYSILELGKAVFGGYIERSTDRAGSHKGFDFRSVRSLLSENFEIFFEEMCPFTILPWWANSQAFFAFSMR